MPIVPNPLAQPTVRAALQPIYDTEAILKGAITIARCGGGSRRFVSFSEGGALKTRWFGSHRRAKRFARHLIYCRRVGDGPTWGPPVDVRHDDVTSRDPQRWRRAR